MRWTTDQNDILYENLEYFNKNKEIAENTFSRSWNAIMLQAYRLGVGKERNYLTSNTAILNEARDYIDGLMLGDGNINGKLYQQGCKHKNWLDKISEDLYEYNIKCDVNNGRLIKNKFVPDGSIIYNLWTRSYVEFKEMYDRFYQKRYNIDNYNKYYWHKDGDGEYFIWQKVVPKDINLSQECVANLYLGDGWYANNSTIIFATNDFLKEDVIFLAELLSETLDIKCGVNKRKMITIYDNNSVNIFLNYIKSYEVDCYHKKFPKNLWRIKL